MCCEPDTRPGQIFNNDGICTPCEQSLIVTDEDWNVRHQELAETVKWAQNRRSPLGYDTILGVSGGKDSTRLAFFAREVGLNPLLVCFTYPPEQRSELGAYNLGNLIRQGFDVITVDVAPEIYKHAIRLSFFKFCNWVNPSEIALYACTPRTALHYNIPLACAGENPFLAGGSGCGSTDGNAINITSLNTLAGGDLTPFMDDHNRPELMQLFRFPEKERILKNDIRMIYLGYYIKDYDPNINADFAIANGMRVRTGKEADGSRTGLYHHHSALDEDYVIVNQYLKYLKLGFNMTPQSVSMDIRAGRLTRNEGIELCNKFDGKCHRDYIVRFCEYLNISEDAFWKVAESSRNRDIWQLKDNKWELKVKLEPLLDATGPDG